jgi:hypothetical protein
MTRLALLMSCVIALHPSLSTVLEAQAPFGLAFSSYYGQFQYDEAADVAVDANGFVYVAGTTESFGTGFDAFVLKLTPDGSQIVYATYFRGSGFDVASAIAVDAAGSVSVVGHTTSSNFPLVTPFQSTLSGDSDVWIAQLDASGTPVRSSYYGGSSFENGYAMALGASGEVYIAGSTGSLDLPGASGLQQTHGGGFEDGFVVKIRADGTGAEYATYLGGSGNDTVFRIAADASGHAYLAGQTTSSNFPVAAALQPAFGGGFNDGFVTKLSPDGSALVFSTYLGGVDRDLVVGIAVDALGAVHVGGSTGSHDFPMVNAYQPFFGGGFADAFLAKFQADGQALTFSTFLGGQGAEAAVRLVLDSQGNLYLGGETDSPNFPVMDPVQPQVNGVDGFVAQLSSDGQMLVQSTPFGGSGLDSVAGLALSPTSEVWFVGRTDSGDLPLVNPFQSWHGGSSDAFIARLGVPPPPNQAPVAVAGNDVQVTASGCTADVILDGTGSSDPDGDPLTFEWSGEFGTATGATATVQLTPGTHTITLVVRDGHGGSATDTVVVTVIADAPPQIVRVTATPNVLSPANHQMVPVAVSVELSGGCVASTTCRIAGVISSEPVSGLGGGDVAPDWEITGPLTLRLRAEHGPRSLGRLYVIVVECVHASGGISRRLVVVAVPRH